MVRVGGEIINANKEEGDEEVARPQSKRQRARVVYSDKSGLLVAHLTCIE